LPRSVINRAQEVLAELENRASEKSRGSRPGVMLQQLSLFPSKSSVAAEISKLDIDSMSPLEAINKLYELRRMAKDD